MPRLPHHNCAFLRRRRAHGESADNTARPAGIIHNPNTGKNYDGTVAMKGPNLLKVQGCIMGGAFCGGTTWKRVS